jgi:hypothetical protein
VVLESAKDRFLGVDTSGQHAPPHFRYGAACLLIRNTIGSVLLGGMGIGMVILPAHLVQERPVGETLAVKMRHVGKP